MKLLNSIAAAAWASVASICMAAAVPDCPTVTETASACQTCAMKACLQLSTISNIAGCPSPVATATVSFPCDGPCPTGCMGTSYVFVGFETSTTPVACPTVTSTREICETCALPLCLAYSTISSVCGCPTAVPTVDVAYPCDGEECPRGCGTTSYIYETGVPSCE